MIKKLELFFHEINKAISNKKQVIKSLSKEVNQYKIKFINVNNQIDLYMKNIIF